MPSRSWQHSTHPPVDPPRPLDPPPPTFFAWLCTQAERQDAVGAFARYAAADKVFPRRSWRLCHFLMRYEGMPVQRHGAKVAHREWRRTRKVTS